MSNKNLCAANPKVKHVPKGKKKPTLQTSIGMILQKINSTYCERILCALFLFARAKVFQNNYFLHKFYNNSFSLDL